jgi:hypothetical protein
MRCLSACQPWQLRKSNCPTGAVLSVVLLRWQLFSMQVYSAHYFVWWVKWLVFFGVSYITATVRHLVRRYCRFRLTRVSFNGKVWTLLSISSLLSALPRRCNTLSRDVNAFKAPKTMVVPEVPAQVTQQDSNLDRACKEASLLTVWKNHFHSTT